MLRFIQFATMVSATCDRTRMPSDQTCRTGKLTTACILCTVYDISVLSNIPLSLFEMLGPTAPSQRLRPLFTIGVHDIPFLIEDQAATAAAAAARKRRPSPTTPLIGADDAGAGAAGSGWVACTTDSILAMKNDLWDVLITMPPPHSPAAKERVWPTVELPGGVQVRATQRDLRRFRNLCAGLARLAPKPKGAFSDSPRPEAAAQPVTPRRPGTSSGWSASAGSQHLGGGGGGGGIDALLADAAEKIVEPTTWAALAYSGFMWWASAGEQRRSEEAEEAANDAGLLTDLAAPAPRSPSQRRGSGVSGASGPLAKASAVGQGLGMADSVLSLPVCRTADGRVVSISASDAAAGEALQQAEEGEAASSDEERARVELAIIAYFRRLTTQIIAVVADIVESGEDDDDEDDEDDDRDEDLTMASAGGDSEPEDTGLLSRGEATGRSMNNNRDDGLDGSVSIDSDALTRMGLDVWSNSDVAFVREVTALYFSRRAKVESKCVEVCGLRVC